MAIGLCGSIAYGDVWPGADLDIEVVVQGDREKEVKTTEQGRISVDYGYFGTNNLKQIPYETSPIYDPEGTLTRELSSRVEAEVIGEGLRSSLTRAQDYLSRAERVMENNSLSAIGWVTCSSWPLAETFTLLGRQMRTHRRLVSRLEKATMKLQRPDIFQNYSTLLGLPQTVGESKVLLESLRVGYREVWSYFKDKPDGPMYMVQQPDSESWFKNRILPLYEYDKRDLVSLVYSEFIFIFSFIFRSMGIPRVPDFFVEESQRFEGGPLKWSERYQTVLSCFPAGKIAGALRHGKGLCTDAQKMLDRFSLVNH